MKNKSVLVGTLAISVLLLLSVLGGTTTGILTVNMVGQLDVVKKVYNGENWVDEINAELDDVVQFKITVTYHNETPGHHYAYNIVVTDTLPSCLEYITDSSDPFEPDISDNVLTWDLDQTILYDEDSYVIKFNATVVDCGENVNTAEVEADEYCTSAHITGSDTATVNVECEPPGIEVEKWIWDGYCEWVDEVHVTSGSTVRFRIEVTNTGGTDLTNIVVYDLLSLSLEYANEATVDGEPWEPDDIIENATGTHLWWTFNLLEIGDTIIIEFDAIVRGQPCDEDINWVEVTGEGPCETVTDEDDAKVFIDGMCMYKEVWDQDSKSWKEETTVGEGEEIRFRITVWYYGDYKLYNIEIIDVLPDCLVYGDEATVNGVSYEPDISGDGKTLWWNLSEDYNLHDGESLVIEFTAYGGENECEPCVNWAYIYADECSGLHLYWEDSATVFLECTFVADAGGPYYGDVDESIAITGAATGGALPYSYAWDMDDDGQYDDAAGETTTWSWSEPGNYVIRVEVEDDDGEKAYDYASVDIATPANNPPNKPSKPSGSSSGTPGTEYTYTSSTTDPDGDQVMYMFDWDDGTDSGWLGPYDSGQTVSAKHTWSTQGSYSVKVKAKDMPSFEDSEWSDSLSVSMPRSRLINNPLLLRILSILMERFPFLQNFL
jgi:uncharacterized repeat protein (TIGR01451 family)/fimbrial isopeptide formation D2 family protein